jgi:hypothetical protein
MKQSSPFKGTVYARKCWEILPRNARNLNWVLSEQNFGCYCCVGLLGFKELRIQLVHLFKDALYRITNEGRGREEREDPYTFQHCAFTTWGLSAAYEVWCQTDVQLLKDWNHSAAEGCTCNLWSSSVSPDTCLATEWLPPPSPPTTHTMVWP